MPPNLYLVLSKRPESVSAEEYDRWYHALERDRHGIGICLGGRRRIGLLLRRLGDAIVRRACGGYQ